MHFVAAGNGQQRSTLTHIDDDDDGESERACRASGESALSVMVMEDSEMTVDGALQGARNIRQARPTAASHAAVTRCPRRRVEICTSRAFSREELKER